MGKNQTDGIRNVCASILHQAVDDWQRLVSGNIKAEKVDCNFKELRKFFKSDYAYLLSSELGLSATDMLDKLEIIKKAKKDKE